MTKNQKVDCTLRKEIITSLIINFSIVCILMALIFAKDFNKFFGFEFRDCKTSYEFKISHIECKDQLISDVINYCTEYNVDFKDLREKNA